jgi:hypothetical protein
MNRPIALALAAFMLAGCGANRTATSASTPPPLTHDDARLAFRASFLHACLAGVPGPEGQTYCACADDKIETIFTDAQLATLTPANPRLKAALHACAAKAGLSVRPGF